MPLTKIKLTFENLNNIIRNGNELLVEFLSKQFVMAPGSADVVVNKLQRDPEGLLYVLKNGSKSYKLSRLKYGLMPSWCPKCKRIMGRAPLDYKFWNIHKLCMNCSIELETKMKILGTWLSYSKNYVLNNIKFACRLAVLFYLKLRTQSAKLVVINDLGLTETWSVLSDLLFDSKIDLIINGINKYLKLATAYIERGELPTMESVD